MKTNEAHQAWSDHYQTALTAHLKHGGSGEMRSAMELGRNAIALKLETLDIARIHEQALLALTLDDRSSKTGPINVQQAKQFFAETIVPIEKTRHAALAASVRIADLTNKLHERTAESEASTRDLEQGVARRQSAEAALAIQRIHLARLLKQSSQLQRKLRAKTRRELSEQEGERIKTSCRLHEDIVQALVAIKIRLQILEKRVKANKECLKKDIAETEQLVKQSVQSILRLSREIDGYHEP